MSVGPKLLQSRSKSHFEDLHCALFSPWSNERSKKISEDLYRLRTLSTCQEIVFLDIPICNWRVAQDNRNDNFQLSSTVVQYLLSIPVVLGPYLLYFHSWKQINHKPATWLSIKFEILKFFLSSLLQPQPSLMITSVSKLYIHTMIDVFVYSILFVVLQDKAWG